MKRSQHLALLALGPVLLLLGGCENSCQRLCDELIDYAMDCDLDVQSGDLTDCKNKQSDASPDELDFCDAGLERVTEPESGELVPYVRLEWTCQELEANVFGAGGT